MRSAALLEHCLRYGPADVFPIASVGLQTKGEVLGTEHYSTSIFATELGTITAVTKEDGFEPISFGPGLEENKLRTVATSVSVLDPTRRLLDLCETYEPRDSQARIRWGARRLMAVDWEDCFNGILEDWSRDGLATKLHLKTDDTVLRTPIPRGTFERAEWGAAQDTTVFGTPLPLIMGIHDSSTMTGRGAVPAVNIRYDKDLGYWWCLAANNLVSVRRIYYDGVVQLNTGWSVQRGVYGGNLLNILVIESAYKPEKGVLVSFDCDGPTSTGGATGTSLTNPVRQLRALLEEWTYRTSPLGLWRGAHPILGSTWDTVATWFDTHQYESARRFGGNQPAESMAQVIQSFLDSFDFVRMWWTPLGQIEIGVLDPEDSDPDNALWLDLGPLYHKDELPYTRGDRKEVYSHVRMPYMWSDADGKFQAAYEAHDVAALPIKVPLVIENPWTQGRYTQD